MKKTRVYFFSEVNWSYIKQRHHIFANFFSIEENTVYVGRIGLRYPNFFDFFKNNNRSKIKNSHNKDLLFSNVFFLPPINKLFDFYNSNIALRLFLLKFPADEDGIIIFFYQPTSLIKQFIKRVSKITNKITLIYDCVQDYRYHPSSSNKLMNLEKWFIKESKFVIADSKINYERFPLKEKRKILIPPGVDVTHFNNSYSGKEFFSHPIKILYYGNIRQDLDFELINKLAENSGIQLTLMGPLNVNKNFIGKDVIIKGPVSYMSLPKLMNDYDSLLLPYKVGNRFTEAIIPAKFFECLATFKPILSTNMKATKEFHYLLNIISCDSMNINIGPLSETDILERKKILKDVSWEKRFNLIKTKIKYEI